MVWYENILANHYYAPAQGALSGDAVWRLSIWRLSDVCRVHPVGGRRVRPAGWMARIGWSGPARPGSAGLAQGCRCALPLQAWAGHIVAAARLQLVISVILCVYFLRTDCVSSTFYMYCTITWSCARALTELCTSCSLNCIRTVPPNRFP